MEIMVKTGEVSTIRRTGLQTMTKNFLKSLAIAALLATWQLPALGQGVSELVPGSGTHVDAQLVSETEAAIPGESLWFALRLVHVDAWHTYWKNPGDAGKPTEIRWQLPEGVTAGEIVWPLPERFDLPADLVDFGYTGEIFLLTELTIPASFAGTSLQIGADAQWLECEEICIPGGASVTLDMPVGTGPARTDSRWADGFDATRRNLPRSDVTFDAMFSITGEDINLLVQATEPVFENAQRITFIPDTHRVLDYIAEQNITNQLSSLQLSQKAHSRALRESPERVGGLLIVEDGSGEVVTYDIQAAPEGVTMAALEGDMTTGTQPAGGMNLFTVFLFAMAGGLILNLMPCVFPVLSLKAMSLASNATAPVREQRLHGIAYAAGVILSFLGLAGVLLTLQAGGSLIGWGFQLQSPWFVAALVFLFFLMGLAMSGVIEIGTGIMGLGSGLADKEGYTGSFFTGVLASVVASPCTAPFMGAALGFAFTQSMPVALIVFVALGFGMALPFLLFSFVPALARMLPRPGSWMLTFRQFLAFPLYATAVWLLWVLGRQTSADAMALVVGGCVFIGLAAWLYQRQSQSKWRYLEIGIGIACIAAVLSLLTSPLLETRDAVASADTAGEGYEVYSDARLEELRRQGRPVFVNMTASWCITCLVNERMALSSDSVMQALADNDVTYLKGDWTNNDPAITEVLKRYQTSGVPLYLMYPADPSQPAEVLPQILTEGIILDALSRI
jgi:thiol:disulfide interchange protein